MLLRNSPRTHEFLDTWAASFDLYEKIENPEQSALEAMYKAPAWQADMHLHDWAVMHAYDTCPFATNAFSMHFPGKLKNVRVPKVWTYFSLLPNAPSWAMDGGKGLTEYAAKLLRDYFARLTSSPAADHLFLPQPEGQLEVQQCLAKAERAAYHVQEAYDSVFHAYANSFDVTSYLTNIPAAIFITQPDKHQVPKSVADKIASWQVANPGYQIVLHNDADVAELVRRLVPDLFVNWSHLLKIQQADIYRYVVTCFLGGLYADSDTICVKPVAAWGVLPTDRLVLGVEAQNVDTKGGPLHEGSRRVFFAQFLFASAAFHPVTVNVLRRIQKDQASLFLLGDPGLDPRERLAGVLQTTGPVAWTDSIAEYMCYATQARTPDDFWQEGSFDGTHIFDVAAFGAGQFHSGSPPLSDSHVLVVHTFKGCMALHGDKWQMATA